MSYLYPTADTNSAGQDRDPITGDRERRAIEDAERALSAPKGLEPYNPFSSWKRITEDLIHFTPIDNLPERERDAIRMRRRKAFKESAIPWIVSDYVGLMQAYDDVDDLLKTKTLIKDYALTPAAKLARKLAKGKQPLLDEKLEGWRESCLDDAPPRQRKLIVPDFGGLNLLAQLGTGALALLFPGWRFALLALQALQTTDSLFGVGLQLGPILGYVMEATFRRLQDVNGPIFDFDNKYEQLKAARVMRNANRALAAAGHAHGDDALTSLTGFYYSSDHDVFPTLVIDQDDYPNVTDIFDTPYGIAKEGWDAARLALSLPYNLGANIVNSVMGDSLGEMSQMLGGPGNAAVPENVADNETQALMRLVEMGICPGGQCEGELVMDALVLSNEDHRALPGESELLSPRDIAKRLKLRVQDPPDPRTLPIDQTPVPET